MIVFRKHHNCSVLKLLNIGLLYYFLQMSLKVHRPFGTSVERHSCRVHYYGYSLYAISLLYSLYSAILVYIKYITHIYPRFPFIVVCQVEKCCSRKMKTYCKYFTPHKWKCVTSTWWKLWKMRLNASRMWYISNLKTTRKRK